MINEFQMTQVEKKRSKIVNPNDLNRNLLQDLQKHLAQQLKP